MSIPVWITPPGSLGTIPEGVFYSVPLAATADETVYYQLIAGNLPAGMFINEDGVLSGNPTAQSTSEGIPLPVAIDTTSKFAIRAYTVSKKLADRTFTITVTGQNTVSWITPAGSIGTYYDGNQIRDLQVNYFDSDIYANPVVRLVSGNLPPGLTISSTGVISGYILPAIPLGETPGYSYNGTQGYSQYPFDFTTISTTTNYEFTLKVTNGQSSDTRTFSILVYALDTMTADNTQITADNTFITADVTPIVPPIITTPVGSIGSVRSDNFFAFQFTAIDFNYNQVEFIATTNLPPGLTLDPNSGWLYGYLPASGILNTTYNFNLIVRETNNHGVTSGVYNFSLTITGPVNSDIVWITNNSDLGSIFNGSTSTFYVEAKSVSGLSLTYQLVSGSDSRLPQGLQLLATGHIAGRVSFDTFAVDGGTTTFDATTNSNTTIVPVPTTFDMVCTFTVQVTSVNGLVNSTKTFSIRVVREYNEPYDNLYIQAMPPKNDRALLAGLLQNKTVFPPNLIYRNDDPNFGVASRVIYHHAYGLTAATLEDYVASLNLNHYWKNLTLGNIKTAQAVDTTTGSVIYEIVYSEVVDDLVNNAGQSVGKSVNLPFVINNDVSTVYPNALVDMRNQVIDVVGQKSNILPLWMLSKQDNGRVLGFTPAWVIAYTNPGQSGQIAYNIETYFGNQLNLIDFEVDRYELDNLLTKNWDRTEQHWVPQPPTLTTFDYGSANYNIDPWISSYTEYYNIYHIVGDGSQATVTWYPEQALPEYFNNIQYYAGDYVLYNNSKYTAITNTLGNLPTNTGYWRLSNTFSVGQVVNISGVIPSAYNGNVTITGSTAFSFTFASSTTTEARRIGQIITLPPVVHWVNNGGEIVVWTNEYNNQPTTFDGNSLQFIVPVDMYSNTNEYDKYLVFPKRNILE